MSRRRLIGGVALVVAVTTMSAGAKKTKSERVDAYSPEEQLASFTVPDGFVVELVASEADGVINPIDMAFDDAGRLWTQTGRMYPLDPVKDIKWGDLLKLMDNPAEQAKNPEFKRIMDLYQGKTRGEDKILVLSDLDGKGRAKVDIFADGMTIPQSVLPYKSGVFVAQGSELFYLDDQDGDGKADERTPVLTGFGFTDTHTMSHTMVRGPGGWIHFSQGALNKGEVTAVKSGVKERFDFSKIGRFSIDGEKLELVSSGLNNIWGFWMRSNGQWFGCEANDQGWSVTPMEPGTGFRGIGNERLRPYQPWMPELHKFRVGGTGISGLAFTDDESGGFPAEWKDVAFLANPITSAVNAVRIVREPDGRVTAQHLPDFLTSEDDWFRPVNMEFGPDGCLYIADWYNKIVSHNELPTTHPDRDKTHGRIWRVRPKDHAARPIPDLTKASAPQLVKHLSAPSAWEKRAAMNQLGDRGLKEAVGDLVALAGDKQATEVTRIHALWTLEALNHYEAGLMSRLLGSELPNLRREAVRAMGSLAPDPGTLNAALRDRVEDANPMVRAEVLRTLTDRGEATAETIDLLVTACKPELPGNAMGGSYERSFERYLARKALESYTAELTAYLSSEARASQPDSHLLWASQALPEAERIPAFLKIWASRPSGQEIDESTFVAIAGMLGDPQVFEAVQASIQDEKQGIQCVALALKNQAQVQSPALAKMLAPVVARMLGAEPTRTQGLDAVARLKVPVDSAVMKKLLVGSPSPQLVDSVLKALQANPAGNTGVFSELANRASLPFATRLSAMHSLVKAAPGEATQPLQQWMDGLDDLSKGKAVIELSASKQGAGQLMRLHDEGLLATDAFDLASAERTHQANKNDPRGLRILNEVKKREAAKSSGFAARLEHLMKVPDRLKGDPAKGKTLFGTCLLCHRVGDEGFNIAPALDGSGHREREALLTAILNPDAAVEGGYLTYRVTKKDGSTLEGYRVKEDERGVTLAFMGGAEVFVPSAEIATKQFADGRSFMPKGLLDAYKDQDVADLLAYIQTLK